MDDHELTGRLRALCEQADRLRLPGHRHTAEQAFAAQDALRAGLRDLYRDLTGSPPRAASPPPPSLHHRRMDGGAARSATRCPRGQRRPG